MAGSWQTQSQLDNLAVPNTPTLQPNHRTTLTHAAVQPTSRSPSTHTCIDGPPIHQGCRPVPPPAIQLASQLTPTHLLEYPPDQLPSQPVTHTAQPVGWPAVQTHRNRPANSTHPLSQIRKATRRPTFHPRTPTTQGPTIPTIRPPATSLHPAVMHVINYLVINRLTLHQPTCRPSACVRALLEWHYSFPL